MQRFILAVVMVWSVFGLCGAAESKHPGVGYPPKFPLEAVYLPDATDPAFSLGDITFTKRKPTAELTPEEIYIVAGAAKSDLPGGRALDPWADSILNMVMAYERVHHAVPPVLDEAAMRSIPYYETWAQTELDVYRNPITGEWPRLDAKTPSPGDLYMRPLTTDETAEFAKRMQREEEWLGTGPGMHLCGHVWYQRVYGTDGPIYESLPHATCPSSPKVPRTQ